MPGAPAPAPPLPAQPLPTASEVRPRIGVSSCLLGEPVRFNGGHSRSRFLTDVLGPYVEWVPCCPEMAIGLGSPRQTLRLTAQGRLVNRAGTADHTAAVGALPLPGALDGYVFKARSPTCGTRGITRYHGNGQPADRLGRGVYAGRLMAEFPLLPVEDDGRLNDPALRESFTERVFALARLRELLSGPWQPRDLSAFQARHKLQLLARDPVRNRQAGRVAARASSRPRDETAARYRELFCAAMAGRATRGRHANALQHALGHISDGLDPARRRDLAGQIDAYRHGHVSLSVPVALLAHHASTGVAPWLASQTYLQPFPRELGLHGQR